MGDGLLVFAVVEFAVGMAVTGAFFIAAAIVAAKLAEQEGNDG